MCDPLCGVSIAGLACYFHSHEEDPFGLNRRCSGHDPDVVFIRICGSRFSRENHRGNPDDRVDLAHPWTKPPCLFRWIHLGPGVG